MASKSDRKKAGRPRLIDAAMREKIIEYAKLVGSRKSAAAKAGISYQTLARDFHANPEFEDALKDAIEVFKSTHVARISLASQKDWKASAFLLERMFPELYGRRNADALTLNQAASLITLMANEMIDALPKKYAALVYRAAQRCFESIHGATKPQAIAD